MFTLETKSMLAKLMATENITVEHRYARTAYFNLQTRILTCPTWKDMDGNLYDLLLGHEISHALHTPPEGWHDAIDAHDLKKKRFKGFLNVVEDARIERLIKSKYPGLRKPMVMGYQDLVKRRFFGHITENRIKNMYLIDKLNLVAKCGTGTFDITFTPQEQPFYDELMQTETWEQVVDLATRLFEYSKTEQQTQKKQDMLETMQSEDEEQEQQEEQEESGEEFDDVGEEETTEGEGETSKAEENEKTEDTDDSSDSSDDEDAGEPSTSDTENDSDEEGEEEDGDEEGEGEEDSHSTKEQKESEEDSNDDVEEEDETGEDSDQCGSDPRSHENEEFIPRSFTDEEFRAREEGLVDSSGQKDVFYATIPTPNLKEIIIPAKTTNAILSQALLKNLNQKQRALKLYVDFNKKNDDYIMLLVKEFEMRKAAKTYGRTKVSDTGDIDIKKIARYRLDDNIFRQVVKSTKGKSHGLVLILDRSGSMNPHLKGAMEQILILAMFCKKVNIPFAAYSFTDLPIKTNTQKQFSKKAKDLVLEDIWFQEMFNSSMSALEFKSAAALHLLLIQMMETREHLSTEFPTLSHTGSTPLCETIIAAREIVQQFREKHRLDIVNTIFVHDGDANRIEYMYNDKGHRDCLKFWKLYITDPKEKISILVDDRDVSHNLREALMRWFQMTAKSGVFGFFIVGGRGHHSLGGALEKYYHDKNGKRVVFSRYNQDAILLEKTLQEELKSNKFIESYTPGYNRFYFIPGEKELQAQAFTMEEERAWTPGRLLNAYKKASKTKSTSRILVSRFIQMISQLETH